MSWTTLPVSRSTHTAKKLTSLIGLAGGSPFLGGAAFSAGTSSAVVTHTWWPSTTGDDQPLPWTAAFHRTFSFSPQVVGAFAAAHRPSAVGPRKPGQESLPGASDTARATADRASRRVR